MVAPYKAHSEKNLIESQSVIQMQATDSASRLIEINTRKKHKNLEEINGAGLQCSNSVRCCWFYQMKSLIFVHKPPIIIKSHFFLLLFLSLPLMQVLFHKLDHYFRVPEFVFLQLIDFAQCLRQTCICKLASALTVFHDFIVEHRQIQR